MVPTLLELCMPVTVFHRSKEIEHSLSYSFEFCDCLTNKNNVCYKAAKSGHVSCLTYARTINCAWNEDVFIIAIIHGQLNFWSFCIRTSVLLIQA